MLHGLLPEAVAQQSNAAFPRTAPPSSNAPAGADTGVAQSKETQPKEAQPRDKGVEQVQAAADRRIRVPYLTGLTLDEARKTAERAGLPIEVRSIESKLPPGRVIRQSPAAEALVPAATTITLFVASSTAAGSSAPAKETQPSANIAPSTQAGAKAATTDPCAAIADSAERLACYDRLSTRPGAPAAKATTTSESKDRPAWAGPPELLGIAIAGDGRRGVAVGAGGVLIVTNDGGDLWKAWRIGASDISAVALSETGNELVVVDAAGARLLSFEDALAGRTDGARTTQLGTGLKAVWRQGDMWIVFGSAGNWYSSTDGAAWTSRQRLDGEFLTRASIEDADLIAMRRGPSSSILRRTAGSRESGWSMLAELPNEHVVALLPLASGSIIAATASGHRYESADGGTLWTRSGTSMPVPRAASTASGSTWMVGNHGAIYSVDRRGNVVPRTSGADGLVTAVAFDRADSRAENLWLAAASGLVLRSVDGARTFEPVGQVPFRVKSLAFSSALRGSARGGAEEEAETSDSGASWTRRAGSAAPVTSDAPGKPRAISSAPARGDGSAAAVLLVLGDRQSRNFASPLAPYARSVAPWAYVAGLAALALLAFAALVPPRPKVQSASVADMLASDKPLDRVTRTDPLKLGPLSAGLARFLRNEATEPPLTIAITGAWGSGKSSLMNLLAGEMRRYGISVVTFNAWHHQKEEHLLASMLTAVKDQAPPRWYSLSGLEFRWHLGMARARRAPLVTALLFFVLGAVIYLALNPGPLQPFADLVKRFTEFVLNPSKGFDWDVSKIPEKLFGAGAFATAVASALTALRRLRAFGVDPAQLTATLASNFSLKEASAQASFRERFAREFCEVTTAMRSGSRPRVLTIFIDDLDRCRPEAVLEVLEAVNFLVSSGDCYIVLGMARERVEACVGLGFEKVAVELVNLASEGKPGEPDADEARRKRREYARQYLEKLINIEVPMPVATVAQAQEIIADDDRRDPRQGGPFEVPAWLASIASFWPLLLAAGLFAAGVGGAQWLARTAPDTAPAAGSPIIASDQKGPAEPAPIELPTKAATATDRAAAGSGELRDAQDGSYGWAPVAALLALAALALVAARLRRVSTVVRDSSDFRLALKIWLPVVVLHQNTPRSIKRFINRVRYLAMLRGQPAPGESDPGPMLVMLAALQQSGAPSLASLADFSTIASQARSDPSAPAAGAVAEALKLQDELLRGAIAPGQFADERRWFEENVTSAHMS
jgi:photosystem II stability/assembly factor-like uncharacterized protein